VGDVGAGKSTLLRHVLSGIQNDPKVRLIFPDCPNRERLDGDGLINQILRSLGVDKIPSPRVERAAMARDYLDKSIGDGVRVALVMDEAHDIPPKVLIALKRLWDSAMLYKLLAIILVGQGGERFGGKPWGLKAKILTSADLREFAERCILVDMPKPNNGYFRDYLSWRLTGVGGDADSVFEAGAIAALAERTDCLQLANNLAMKAMKAACKDGQTKVSAEMVSGH
jgi:type II secretory pathway predicted ATPase ExeA